MATDWRYMEESDEFSEADIRDSLQQNIDMSEYESAVYFALIRNGKQSMKAVAETSGVPKQRVYDIVEELRDRGFVKLDDSYPKMAYAVEPTKTLGPIHQQIQQVQSQLEELHTSVADIESGVSQFSNVATIRKYISELLGTAEQTVFLLTTVDRFQQFRSDLRGLSDVQVRVVISGLSAAPGSGEISVPDAGTGLIDHVRVTDRSEPFVLTVDRNRGFFWPTGEDTDGSYVTDTELAFLFDRFLSESVWPLAKPIDSTDDRRPALPQEYFRLRDCLADLRALSRDVPLESLSVSVDGRDTVSDEHTTFDGVLSGFQYAEVDNRMSLEVEIDDGQRRRTVTVGGWRSQRDDYRAHRVELRERGDWPSEGVDEDTRGRVQTCLSELPEAPSDVDAAVGFDGYIDHIRRLVGERKSPRMFDEMTSFESLRQQFSRATPTETTLQFEWVESSRVPGGHTAHAGQSLSALGYDLRLLGYFGHPIREEFESEFPDAELLSLGQPTVTEYLQFDDGKVMFTEGGSHQALNWETLCEYVPLSEMAGYLNKMDIVTIGGWPLIPEISTIWEGLGEQVYPMLETPPADVLVLVGDVDRLRETTLRSDLESLSALDERIPVTVVSTGEQASHLGTRIFEEESQLSEVALARRLRESVGVSRFAVTSPRESALATDTDAIRVRSPRVENPAEEGTFEDHFTAGLALGRAEELSTAGTLVVASAVAGYFRQHQQPPTFDELVAFIESYGV